MSTRYFSEPGAIDRDQFAPSSRPVARVHTGATGTLVPVSRDHLATWNERARSVAIGCALSTLSCGRSSGRYRPVSNSAAVSARLLDLACWKPTDHSPRKYWHLPTNRPFVEDSTISGCFPVCEARATTRRTPGAVCFAHGRIGIAFA